MKLYIHLYIEYIFSLYRKLCNTTQKNKMGERKNASEKRKIRKNLTLQQQNQISHWR